MECMPFIYVLPISVILCPLLLSTSFSLNCLLVLEFSERKGWLLCRKISRAFNKRRGYGRQPPWDQPCGPLSFLPDHLNNMKKRMKRWTVLWQRGIEQSHRVSPCVLSLLFSFAEEEWHSDCLSYIDLVLEITENKLEVVILLLR